MKAEPNEYNEDFWINLTAETLEEAAMLVRLGINSTAELKLCEASAIGKEIAAVIEIGKRKSPKFWLPKVK